MSAFRVAASYWTRVLDAFADDVVWTQPGTTRLSGTHRGRDAVVAFFLEVASYALVVRPLEYFGDGERVVAVVDVELAGERANGSIASPAAMPHRRGRAHRRH